MNVYGQRFGRCRRLSTVIPVLALLGIAPAAHGFECELVEEQKVLNLTPSNDDWFGFATAIDGNLAAVGELDGDGSLTDLGTVSTYRYNVQSGEWDFIGRLEAPDAFPNDHFGYAVAIDGDVLVIGAPYRDAIISFDTGAVYIYRFDGSSFAFEQKLLQPVPDMADDDLFGYDVAIWNDRIAVGAIGDDEAGDRAGAVYIFSYDDSEGWTQDIKLTASDAADNDVFGWSVSMEGARLAVGAPGDDGNGAGIGAGAVYVFETLTGAWFQREILWAPTPVGSDNFGLDVSIAADSTLLVGAPGDDEVDISSGAAYVYRRTNPILWTLDQKLLASDADRNDSFGYRVALEGDVALVTARGEDNGGSPGSGSAYSFVSDGASWIENAKIGATDNLAGNNYGAAVDLDGDLALIGSYHSDDGALEAGAAYFTTILCPPVVGDMNCDGVVDIGDVAPFATALVNAADYAVQYPGCDPLNGDTTNDGLLNGADVQGIIAVLIGL